MQPVRSRPWSTTLSRILFVLAIPLFLLAAWTILVAWPAEVVRGLASIGSGRDVVQVADGMKTGVTLLLLLLILLGLCWLLRPRWRDRLSLNLMIYGMFLWVPVTAALGLGAEYGLQGMLSARGYGYCTFHMTDTGKGGDGSYVYVRRAVPDGCRAVQAIFPPHQMVTGRGGPFDLPVR